MVGKNSTQIFSDVLEAVSWCIVRRIGLYLTEQTCLPNTVHTKEAKVEGGRGLGTPYAGLGRHSQFMITRETVSQKASREKKMQCAWSHS